MYIIEDLFETNVRAIEYVPAVVQPILDLICKYTSMKALLIIGGSELVDGGCLNIIRLITSSFIPHFIDNFGIVCILVQYQGMLISTLARTSTLSTRKQWYLCLGNF